jgi:flavin-dependent dehydrogenase
MKDVIIIGAGLSGLTTAYYLKQKGIDVLLLEGAGANRRKDIHVVSPAKWYAG